MISEKDELFNELKEELELKEEIQDLGEYKSEKKKTNYGMIGMVFFLFIAVLFSIDSKMILDLLQIKVTTFLIIIFVGLLVFNIIRKGEASVSVGSSFDDRSTEDFAYLMEDYYLSEYKDEIIKLVKPHFKKYGYISDHVYFSIEGFKEELECIIHQELCELEDEELIKMNTDYMKKFN